VEPNGTGREEALETTVYPNEDWIWAAHETPLPDYGKSRRSWFAWLGVFIAGVSLGGLGCLGLRAAVTPPRNPAGPVVAGNALTAVPAAEIVVDIHGDVRHPGVYRLPEDARVEDAVRAAGGYLHPEDARGINAAQLLTDGEEVTIPDLEPSAQDAHRSAPDSATPAPSMSQGSAQPAVSVARVDLNTASLSALETLPGIGPAKAQAIIEYRTSHGGFRSVDELLQVQGIGPGTLARIRNYLFLGGS
jgi:competence protein ComEA